MPKLLSRTRTRTDYLAFLLSREWPVLLSATGVVLGVVTLLPSALGLALSVLALLLGTITLIRDVRLLRGRWSAYDFSTIAAPFPSAELPPPLSYPDARYLHIPNRGTVMLSAEMDKALQTRRFTVEIDEEPYRLPARLRATAPHVLPLQARGRLLFNGNVLGMHGEPLPAAGSEPGAVRLHRARFFDGQCSNEVCRLRITETATGVEHDLRRHELIDSSGRVRPLSASTLADLVGVSTIAMTSDGFLLAIVQSERNSASPLLLAPAGSGTLEPRDAKGSDDLTTIVRTAMERELLEETGVKREEVRATKVLGFGRWMERGAKPEFFGLTTLSVTSDQVRGRKPVRAERLYSSAQVLIELDLSALGAELRAGHQLLDAPSLPNRVRDDGSVPLLLGIRAAALWSAS
ncbi:hypothetical protein [Allokutzneria albata]|uniref:Nudix hydrolase domain-containing protein n=1 Tax=Allokutzneria albata TaxID=211114 RepID=A0A1G9UU00_ALLAB|nr:hypothetical protein [Allokutzneria albata]SDM63372.1 hypothetical protein SAMN04489726_2624 [Allokutzneria albata]